MSKNAIILLTHFLDHNIVTMFQRLRAESSVDYDVFIALNVGNDPLILPQDTPIDKDPIFLCNNEKLLALGYPEKCRPEGWSGDGWKVIDNVDTILLAFHKDHPEYDYYWGVEYDVHYVGRWGFLFERFESSKADLLGAMLDNATKTPTKVLMPPFRMPDGKQPNYHDAVVGFFPLHRLSQRFLRALDEAYAKGWNGHYEFTWGTIARWNGLEIEDIGGSGPYVKAANKNVFYFSTIKRWDMSPGTFVFRPVFAKIQQRENTLWHPVKARGNYLNHCPALPEKNLVGWIKNISKQILYNVAIWAWFQFRWQPASSATRSSQS